MQEQGYPVSMVHLRHLNPFQKNLESVLNNFDKVLVPEMNLGQLSNLLRAEFLVETIPYAKVQGRPFLISEIRSRVLELIDKK